MSEVATEEAAPKYELGSVNTDSLIEVLNMLGGVYPFQDENSKIAYHNQVNALGTAGDPNAEAEIAAVETADVAALEAKVAELQAQLANANQSDAGNAGGSS